MPKKNSPGCKCCGPPPCSSGRICITVTDACPTPSGVPGATVTVKNHATGAVIGTCTVDSTGSCCIAIPNETSYDVTASVTGFSDQTTTVTARCDTDTPVSFNFGKAELCDGGQFCVTVSDACSPSRVIGYATITATAADGTVLTCTANSVGQCCINVPNECVYTIQAKVPGASSTPFAVMGICNVTTDVNVTIEHVGTICVAFVVCDDTNTLGALLGNPSAAIGGSITASDGTTTSTAIASTIGPSGQPTACLVVGAGTALTVNVVFPDGQGCTFTDFSATECATSSTSVTELKTQWFNVSNFHGYPIGCTVTFTLTGDTTGTCVLTTTAGGPPVDVCRIALSPPLISCSGAAGPPTYFLEVTTSGGNNNSGLIGFSGSLTCLHSASNNPNTYILPNPGC